MTYAEMIQSDDDLNANVYAYSENGVKMGVGMRREIDRTIKELSIDTDTMQFELVR